MAVGEHGLSPRSRRPERAERTVQSEEIDAERYGAHYLEVMATRERFRGMRRGLNVLVAPLIRLGVAGSDMFMLTVEGRTSGRRYSTPVKLVVDGDTRWLVAPVRGRSWVKNARASGRVELSRAWKTERACVTEVAADEAGPVLRRYLRSNGVTRSFFDARPGDPVEAFVREAHRHAVFRLSAEEPRPPAAG